MYARCMPAQPSPLPPQPPPPPPAPAHSTPLKHETAELQNYIHAMSAATHPMTPDRNSRSNKDQQCLSSGDIGCKSGVFETPLQRANQWFKARYVSSLCACGSIDSLSHYTCGSLRLCFLVLCFLVKLRKLTAYLLSHLTSSIL